MIPPSIAVVMPVVGLLRYTQQALTSLKAPCPLEIILIDNASEDDTPAWAQTQELLYLRQERNLGVAASWNLGIRLGFERGHRYVLVLNNDLVLAPDSIEALLQWKGMGIGVPTLHTIPPPVGRLQEVPREHWVVTPADFAGFLVDQEVMNTVGHEQRAPGQWFDEQFWPAYWEDVDMEHRLTLAGISRGQCLDALAVHFWSRTIHEGGVQLGDTFAENRQRLVAKWGKMPSRT